MASSYIIELPVGNVPCSVIDTFARVPVGYVARGYDNQTGKSSVNVGAGQFIYCRGSNATTNGQFVHISASAVGGGVSAVLLASANSTVFWDIGVLCGALTGTGQFGWVQVQGICDYATCSNTSVAANAYIALGSTAGQVGSVTALGSRLMGIAIPNSFTSSQTSLTVWLDYPRIIGVTASN